MKLQTAINRPVAAAELLERARFEGTPQTRPPLERIARIYAVLSAGVIKNCVQFAAEFEVSTRTVKRDLDFMRDRLRLPIEYDAQRYGFRLVK